jgi:hypothetical protein
MFCDFCEFSRQKTGLVGSKKSCGCVNFTHSPPAGLVAAKTVGMGQPEKASPHPALYRRAGEGMDSVNMVQHAFRFLMARLGA